MTIVQPSGAHIPNASLVVFGGVTDDGSIIAGGSRKRATVTNVLLNVADDST